MNFSIKKLSKSLISAIFLIVAILVFAAFFLFASAPSSVTKTSFSLNTIVTVTLYGNYNDSLIEDCFELCRKYEKIFSRTDPESELSKLNLCRSMPVSDELLELIKICIHYSELSAGKFDITIGKVSGMWNFLTDTPAIPDPASLAKAVSHIDYSKIDIDGNTVTLQDPEAVIDLGAAAKGYIADRLKDFLISNGVEHATIDLGGNILCIGGKTSRSDFQIGLQFPFESGKSIAVIGINDLSVVTSGIYERYFEINGKLYHHILDPDTGYPISNDLLSVSIISESSADGDALSTAVFALGLEDGIQLINSLDGIYAVFITSDLHLHFSDGFLETFNIQY